MDIDKKQVRKEAERHTQTESREKDRDEHEERQENCQQTRYPVTNARDGRAAGLQKLEAVHQKQSTLATNFQFLLTSIPSVNS